MGLGVHCPMQSVTYRCREFPVLGIFHFVGGIGTSIATNWNSKKSFGTGIRNNWYWKKVSEPVSVKFGIEKKSWNRYREDLVPTKSTGISIEHIWYRKKSIGICIV